MQYCEGYLAGGASPQIVRLKRPWASDTGLHCMQVELVQKDCSGFTVWIGALVRAAIEQQQQSQVQPGVIGVLKKKKRARERKEWKKESLV